MESIRESKLFELLKGFSPAEYKALGDFVLSPYYNKNRSIINLYEYLKKFSNDFANCKVTNEDISRYVYNDRKLNSVKVRSLTSDFVKLIEKFLIASEFETYGMFHKVLLLYQLNMKDMPKNFRSVLHETMQKQMDTFNRDENYYYNQIYLEVESFNYNLERQHTNVDVGEFKKIGNNIDLFFILTKLNLFHLMFYHRLDIDESSSYKLWLLDETLEYIESRIDEISKQHPVIYMKYLVLKTITNSGEEHYFRALKKFALDNVANFDNVTMTYIFGALTNYCTIKCNLGVKKFKLERYKIYQILDEKKIFDHDKYISYVDFLNAIISSLEINKVDWAEYFYNKNKDRIFPSLQEDTLNLAKAQILYMKKNYTDAIKLINNVSYTNHYFYLRSKMLLARLYYDKNELEPIIYLLDAAKHFLKRNTKVTKMNRDAFGNFFNFMTKILSLKGHKKPNIKELRDELLKQTNVSSKEWLLRKLDEMD